GPPQRSLELRRSGNEVDDANMDLQEANRQVSRHRWRRPRETWDRQTFAAGLVGCPPAQNYTDHRECRSARANHEIKHDHDHDRVHAEKRSDAALDVTE